MSVFQKEQLQTLTVQNLPIPSPYMEKQPEITTTSTSFVWIIAVLLQKIPSALTLQEALFSSTLFIHLLSLQKAQEARSPKQKTNLHWTHT